MFFSGFSSPSILLLSFSRSTHVADIGEDAQLSVEMDVDFGPIYSCWHICQVLVSTTASDHLMWGAGVEKNKRAAEIGEGKEEGFSLCVSVCVDVNALHDSQQSPLLILSLPSTPLLYLPCRTPPLRAFRITKRSAANRQTSSLPLLLPWYESCLV